MSTSAAVHQGTVLSPDDGLLYEVVDNQVVELAPIGAYEVWIATSLVARIETVARQHQLGRAVRAMLFDLTAATGGSDAQMWHSSRLIAGRGIGASRALKRGRWFPT